MMVHMMDHYDGPQPRGRLVVLVATSTRLWFALVAMYLTF